MGRDKRLLSLSHLQSAHGKPQLPTSGKPNTNQVPNCLPNVNKAPCQPFTLSLCSTETQYKLEKWHAVHSYVTINLIIDLTSNLIYCSLTLCLFIGKMGVATHQESPMRCRPLVRNIVQGLVFHPLLVPDNDWLVEEMWPRGRLTMRPLY